MKHRRREGSKNKDMISSRKIDHRIFFEFFGSKIDTEMMKKRVKKKYEKKNEIKNKREKKK